MNNLKKEIINGKFSSAYMLCDTLLESEVKDVLNSIAYSDNILAYGFCCYILMHKPTAENHILASTICIVGCDINGSYTLAYHHGIEAVKSSDDIKYKKYILDLYQIPDIEMSDEEAICMAKKILEVEPDYELALSIIDVNKKPVGVSNSLKKR